VTFPDSGVLASDLVMVDRKPPECRWAVETHRLGCADSVRWII